MKIYKGVFGNLYKVSNGVVLMSEDGVVWQRSKYGTDLDFFQDGIDRGYLKEVTK